MTMQNDPANDSRDPMEEQRERPLDDPHEEDRPGADEAHKMAREDHESGSEKPVDNLE